jgi:tRNA threonylcarbamoyladenosine biosynthesis protein TsaB
VSAAKGIAEALGRPVVAVNTLEVLAVCFTGFNGVIAPMLDARREQVYCAAFDGDLKALIEPCAARLAEFLKHPALAGARATLFAGDGAMAFREIIESELGQRAVFAPPHLMLQHAGAAAWLAYKKAQAGQTMDASDLLPIYLRKSQAEQSKEAREAGHEG